MKKQVLVVAALLSAVVATSKLQAFCFYNQTGNKIKVLAFRNKKIAKTHADIQKIVSFGQEEIAPVAAKQGGEAGAIALKLGKQFNLNKWMFEAIASVWRKTIDPNKTACWNWLNYVEDKAADTLKSVAKLTPEEIDLVKKIAKFEEEYGSLN